MFPRARGRVRFHLRSSIFFFFFVKGTARGVFAGQLLRTNRRVRCQAGAERGASRFREIIVAAAPAGLFIFSDRHFIVLYRSSFTPAAQTGAPHRREASAAKRQNCRLSSIAMENISRLIFPLNRKYQLIAHKHADISAYSRPSPIVTRDSRSDFVARNSIGTLPLFFFLFILRFILIAQLRW